MPAMIDEALARFLSEGLSIHIGTRDGRLRPSGARASAVTVDPDGRHILVYVPELATTRILPDLESNAQMAVSVGRPVDDRACQVKGLVTAIRPATPDERPIVRAQWQAFMRQLEAIGIPGDFTLGWTPWPAIAVRLRVTAVFEQTPGPQAGTPIA
jgi:hypothetical protein